MMPRSTDNAARVPSLMKNGRQTHGKQSKKHMLLHHDFLL